MSVTRSIPWGGWAGLKRLVDLAPVLVGCLALVSPVREVVPWLGVVGVLMVLAHLWKHQTFPT